MFRDAIDGLENVIETEIPSGTIILISGPAGSLKSGFTYSFLSNHLVGTDEFGVYVTLEETTESHLRNMYSLGIDIPDNLIISDYTNIRERFGAKGGGIDFLDMINAVIDHFKAEKGDSFTCFALDSLVALYALIGTTDLRLKMYEFFKGLREKRLTSLMIMELPEIPLPYAQTMAGCESFLVDGVIQLGNIETKQDVSLYLQVKKMRATQHSRKKHLIEIGPGGLSILGPVFE